MRDTNPVHFFLGNTVEEQVAARAYIPHARVQLEQTKRLMEMGGLRSYVRGIRLFDGTVIVCNTSPGADMVSIRPRLRPVTPARPRVQVSAAAKKKLVKVSKTAYDWFQLPDGPPKHGHQSIWDIDNKCLWVWGGYDRPGMDIPAAPRVADWDDDTVWNARPGGTVRYAYVADHTFQAWLDAPDYEGGLPTTFWHATDWFAYDGGPIIGEGPRTGADLVAQLYIGGTWQDKADAVRYDMPRAPINNYMVDMLPSTALWKFEFTAGMPWTAASDDATTGEWTNLGNLSYDGWQAIKTGNVSITSVSINNVWAPDRGDALNRVTYNGGDFYRADTDDYYPDYTADDYFELYFGGTITGAATSASRQLWFYGPVVSVTYEEQDDFT